VSVQVLTFLRRQKSHAVDTLCLCCLSNELLAISVDDGASSSVQRLDQTCKIQKYALSASLQRGLAFREHVTLSSGLTDIRCAAHLPVQANEGRGTHNVTLQHGDEELRDNDILRSSDQVPPSSSLAHQEAADRRPILLFFATSDSSSSFQHYDSQLLDINAMAGSA
jgi:hypothetical protein